MQLKIRMARDPDAPGFARLSSHLQAVHACISPAEYCETVDHEKAVAFFLSTIRSPTGLVAVAEIGNALAGYALCGLIERPENPFIPAANILYVQQIVVAPLHRRQGIGTALLSFIETASRTLGADEIALDTLVINHDAQRFFSRRGFVSAATIFRRPVTIAHPPLS